MSVDSSNQDKMSAQALGLVSKTPELTVLALMLPDVFLSLSDLRVNKGESHKNANSIKSWPILHQSQLTQGRCKMSFKTCLRCVYLEMNILKNVREPLVIILIKITLLKLKFSYDTAKYNHTFGQLDSFRSLQQSSRFC